MIKTVAYSLRTDRQTDGRTDKSLKTEGPMILSIDIFYFKTVIIGGPISRLEFYRIDILFIVILKITSFVTQIVTHMFYYLYNLCIFIRSSFLLLFHK